ncbi:hypothetical protein [Streptomyces sp. NPDC102409]|uniref:hypothetical protein n=1 Tax=Streptomyces sp. NPDC102409 TaxID=3366172 RepID=UPI003818D410
MNRRGAAPASDRAGRWDVVLETQDPVEFRERVRRLQTGPRPADLSELRIDTLCGRLAHPTTYRLSRYVPSDA